MNNVSEALNFLLSGKDLTKSMAGDVISAIMSGNVSPVQIAAVLTALRCKGETVDEIAGAAEAMRSHAVAIPTSCGDIIDTCGTGGDQSGSINISTTAAFVVAGAGAVVAKHGNRSATSRCGSIDLLEQLGVNVNLGPELIAKCLEEIGLGILFARTVHPAMKFAAPIRGELGFRTIFNFLGPLTNPARPSYQLVGISNGDFLDTYAQCLQKLGIRRAWVVFGEDGFDEITLTGPTTVMDVCPDAIQQLKITPEDAGLKPCEKEELIGGSAERNAEITREILGGVERGPCRDAVALNAGAALHIAGKTPTLKEGVALALESIESGKAMSVLERLIRFSTCATVRSFRYSGDSRAMF
jgi:anthranilate phosphoribosyltransferase